jgi:hypothetical protein
MQSKTNSSGVAACLEIAILSYGVTLLTQALAQTIQGFCYFLAILTLSL